MSSGSKVGYWMDSVWQKWRRMHVCYAQAKENSKNHGDPPIDGKNHQVPYKSDLDVFAHSNKTTSLERVQQWIKNNEENKERHYLSKIQGSTGSRSNSDNTSEIASTMSSASKFQ